MTVDDLFPEMNPVRRACLLYAMRCISHRLRKLGFENSINKLQPRELMLLSTMLYKHQAEAVKREAIRRDPNLAIWSN